METLFWISIAVIFYTYLGYGLLLFVVTILKNWFGKERSQAGFYTPSLTIIVTAYNEAGCIEEKITNTFSLQYPKPLVSYIFVTDGSDDGTENIVAKYPRITLLHAAKRCGKTAAIQRAMQQVRSEIVLFTDANTLLNEDALLKISRHYADMRTGAVAGEKRVDNKNISDATAGEGMYWRYESLLKKYESAMYSVAGAAGELFSIRTSLYQAIPQDTLLDDLVLSMHIAMAGYRISYEPLAYATEKTSPALTEESKRKQRIAAGAIQAFQRLPFLSLLFSKPLLWLTYTSHRVMRWLVTPYLLPAAWIMNCLLVINGYPHETVKFLWYTQSLFYTIASIGWLLRKQDTGFRLIFIPYYFCLMNYWMISGSIRYLFNKQNTLWEKSARR